MTALATRFHVGAGTQVGPVTVFPVWSQDRSDQQYITSAPKGLEIEELKNAEVSSLQVTNGSKETILIPEGTIVYGGLQTRVMTRDVLLPAGVQDVLDVRCVEQGRWGSKVPTSFAGRAPLPVLGALRGLRLKSRNEFMHNYFMTGETIADQHDVWQRVKRFEKTYGTRSSSSLESILNMKTVDRIISHDMETNRFNDENARVTEEIKFELKKMAESPLPGQNGVIVGLSGHPVLFEVFSNEGAFREQLGSILDAVALDAPHANGEPTPSRRAIRFAECIMDQALVQSDFSESVLSGSSELLNTRSLIGNTSEAILHTLVVNARHELVLAS